MKGHIKNLGKNRKKTYFFIKGEDGNSYFANISDVESDGAPKATMFPYIWEGAFVENFTVETEEDGKTRAKNIRLSGRVSTDSRYWSGRSDALKEFAYWYMAKGERAGFRGAAEHLNDMIGWAGTKEQRQHVSVGTWKEVDKKLPKYNVPVLLQVYDVNQHDAVILTAIRKEDAWYEVLGMTKIIETLYVPEAWMPLPDKWEDRRTLKM